MCLIKSSPYLVIRLGFVYVAERVNQFMFGILHLSKVDKYEGRRKYSKDENSP